MVTHRKNVLFSFSLALPVGAVSVSAELPKVEEKGGHFAPLQVRITFTDGTTREALLLGTSCWRCSSFLTRQFAVRTEDSTTTRALWLNIAAVRAPPRSAEGPTASPLF